MKISMWVTVSDLVDVRQTVIEKIIDIFDKKHTAFQSYSHDHTFRLLKKAGIDGMELLIPLHTSDKNITDVMKIMDRYNIPVFSIHQSLSNQNRISYRDIQRLCMVAQKFRASVVVLHSGTLGTKLFDTEFVNSLKSLQKKYRVIFGIENMDKSFLPAESFTYNGDDFASIVKKMGFFMTFDTTHLAQVGENIIDFYRANKKRIINIHLSNYKEKWLGKYLLPQMYTHLSLKDGELPMKKFLAMLKKENYKGLVTMETNSNLDELCESARFINKYIK